MHSQPSASELVEAVRAFLEQRVLPELEGRTAFHARVAVNALAIVARELEHGPAARAAELIRLRALLAGTGDDVVALNRELCARIRAGELTLADPQLVEHLWQTVLAQLAIDQPKYEAYRRADLKSEI